MNRRLMLWIVVAAGCAPDPAVWYQGNLHTHTLWSDGNQFPEVIVTWYLEHGYDFLSISDHNTLGEGERWISIDTEARARALAEYRAAYDADWIESRTDSVESIRLKSFSEYSPLFNSDSFALILGEEITSRFETRPLHVNATNVVELIPPATGNSVVEVLQGNVDAVLEQRARTGQPMFPHINHPNYGWAVTVEDLMALEGERFFELYNGHPLVHNEGDSLRPSTERMWDIILSDRVRRNEPIMFGIAVDDSHHYLDFTPERVNPGRGWVSVRAEALTPAAIIEAMERGDFYGSSGVELLDVRHDDRTYDIVIAAEEGVEYVTHFIGTRQGYDTTTVAQPPVDGLPASRLYSDDIGEILATVPGAEPSYQFDGSELYVRARITSNKRKQNPYLVGEFERAWVQPVILYRP